MTPEDMIVDNDIICTNNNHVEDKITINNKYKITGIDANMRWIRLMTDSSTQEWYSISRFLTIAEWRHKKIDEVLN